MENTIQIGIHLGEPPTLDEEMFPIQEKIANLVTFQYERLIANILAECAAEAGTMIAAPVYIP